jgi:biopolymer transport protein ExbD
MAMNLGNGPGPQASINVTPMIDVLLVLLIIFMAVAPETPHGFAATVPAPVESTSRPPEPDHPVVLEISSAGGLQLNTQLVAQTELYTKLAEIFSRNAGRVLFLRAAPELEYARIARAIDMAKDAGADRIALLTRQPGL